MSKRETFLEYDVRKDFPIFENYKEKERFVYLDSAATSFTPEAVTNATDAYHHRVGGTVHRASYSLSIEASSQYQLARETVREFINAPMCEEVIFTAGSTASLNMVAHMAKGIKIHKGSDILVVETEHHGNLVPWYRVAKEMGAHLKPIPVHDDGRVDLEAYQALLSENTAVVAVAHVSNVTGVIHPVAKMATLAREVGAWTVCDGAQAVAHLPVDVVDLGVDFYAFSAHKMYGPTGIGVLWGKMNWLEEAEPLLSGGDMVESVSFDHVTYVKPPLKFEAGTPNIAAVTGLKAAIEYLNRFDREQVAQWEHSLIDELKEGLRHIEGVRLHGQSQSSVLSFSIEGLHAFDIGMMLNLKGIAVRTGHLCAMPTLKKFGVESVVRASVGLYNTREEIAFFNRELLDVVRSLQVHLEV